MILHRNNSTVFYSTWEVWAPAKLNLCLNVLEKRPDGFHGLESLFVPLAYHDTLFFKVNNTKQPSDISLVVETPGLACRSTTDKVPADERNLVVQAVQKLQERAGTTLGASMRLVKRIPSQAGLGGGSSDAAAALRVANRAWKLGWTNAQLAELGAEIGSDVPFFLQRSAAVCRGRGEKVSPVQRGSVFHFVLAKPQLGLSTQRVFEALDGMKAAKRTPQTPDCVEAAANAFASGHRAALAQSISNQLQNVAATLTSWHRPTKKNI